MDISQWFLNLWQKIQEPLTEVEILLRVERVKMDQMTNKPGSMFIHIASLKANNFLCDYNNMFFTIKMSTNKGTVNPLHSEGNISGLRCPENLPSESH